MPTFRLVVRKSPNNNPIQFLSKTKWCNYRCMSVNVTVWVHDRKDVIVEGPRQVLDHWVVTGQQLVQDVGHCGGRDPFSGVNS